MNDLDTIYGELAEILQKMPRKAFQKLRASTVTHTRFESLKRKSLDQGLTVEEQEELIHFEVLDRLLQATAERY
ncbi:MAG: hypothetical protein RIC19_04460 [Phaeodactylibacter sp.]|uniref:hypothetical protein n=1 Tax=Phaeodactylibacter sp. TaxID=1940289 RepID=UPI0032EB0D5B